MNKKDTAKMLEALKVAENRKIQKQDYIVVLVISGLALIYAVSLAWKLSTW